MASDRENSFPMEIHRSFVSSFFGNLQTSYSGIAVILTTFLVVYVKTGHFLYLIAAATFIAVSIYRMIWFYRFHAAVSDHELDEREVALYERHYLLGGSAVALILGVVTAYSIAFSGDVFAEFTTVILTMASMVSVVGRNYGSGQAVLSLTLLACAPLGIAFLWTGDPFMFYLAFLTVPFVLTTMSMANAIREFLYQNVVARRDISLIADRFDTALNNMPHGLFMLDDERRIVVANRKACELLDISDQDSLKDCDLMAVLRYAARQTYMASNRQTEILNKLDLLIDGDDMRSLIRFSDDLYLEFSANPRADGGVVLIFEDVTARIRAENRILQLARYDTLTGLPNREYFTDLIEKNLAAGGPGAYSGLMVLNVDEMKVINDLHGHAVGDQLLCELARRIQKRLGSKTIAARWMGDEFAIFFEASAGRSRLEKRIKSFHAGLSGPFVIDQLTFQINISAGYGLSTLADFRLADMQIKADLALTDAKLKDRGNCIAFKAEMDESYRDRQQLKRDLRVAIASGEVNVVYQPMFSMDGLRIDCVEALARWSHRERGPVGPNVFIKLAEEMGLVSDITEAVLKKACMDAVGMDEHMAVSVNLSVHDLRSNVILDVVRSALQTSGLAPRRLHLEVTESCFMEDPLLVSRILHDLRAMGVAIAIDDFGTGYSSLSYLDNLPLDIVKIDRSFVNDIVANARRFKVLRGTVSLLRQLGLEIVIEGVETHEQLAMLKQYNCADYIQGYIYSPPVPLSAIHELSNRLRQNTELPQKDSLLTA